MVIHHTASPITAKARGRSPALTLEAVLWCRSSRDGPQERARPGGRIARMLAVPCDRQRTDRTGRARGAALNEVRTASQSGYQPPDHVTRDVRGRAGHSGVEAAVSGN